MKLAASRSPKIKLLMKFAGISRAQAVGHLELMWLFATDQTPAGNVGRWQTAELEDELDWQGDRGELEAALVESGWLDTCKEQRLVIHDWDEHAPEFLKKRAARGSLAFYLPVPEDSERRTTADNGGQRPPVADNVLTAGKVAHTSSLVSSSLVTSSQGQAADGRQPSVDFALTSSEAEDPEAGKAKPGKAVAKCPPKLKPEAVAKAAWPKIVEAFAKHGRKLVGDLKGDRLEQIAKRAADGHTAAELIAAVHGYVQMHKGLKQQEGKDYDPGQWFYPKTVYKQEGFSDRVDAGFNRLNNDGELDIKHRKFTETELSEFRMLTR